MKKIASIVVSAMILMAFIGCGGGSESNGNSSPEDTPASQAVPVEEIPAPAAQTAEDSKGLYPLEYYPQGREIQTLYGESSDPYQLVKVIPSPGGEDFFLLFSNPREPGPEDVEILRLNPPQEGTGRWISPRIYHYHLKNPREGVTSIRGELLPIHSLGGKGLSGNRSFRTSLERQTAILLSPLQPAEIVSITEGEDTGASSFLLWPAGRTSVLSEVPRLSDNAALWGEALGGPIGDILPGGMDMELPYDVSRGGYPFDTLLNGDGFGTVGFSTSPGGEAELIIQVTNLGITSRRGGNRLVVFITSLSDGVPVEGARVSLAQEGQVLLEEITDPAGLISFPLGEGFFAEDPEERHPSSKAEFHIIVESAGDRADLISTPPAKPDVQEKIFLQARSTALPGDEISLYGLDFGTPQGRYRGSFAVTLRDRESGKSLAGRVTGTVSAEGSFIQRMKLPPFLPPGEYLLRYERPGGSADLSLTILPQGNGWDSVSWRDPDYPSMEGEPVNYPLDIPTGTASPFSGRWWRSRAEYQPPGESWDPYKFGASPDEPAYLGEWFSPSSPGGGLVPWDDYASTGFPYNWGMELKAANDEIVRFPAMLVHPSSFYLGVKWDSPWNKVSQAGETLTFHWVMVDPQGKLFFPHPGSDLTAEILTDSSGETAGIWTRRISTGGEPEGVIPYTPPRGGRFLFRLTGEDPAGRKTVTQVPFVVSDLPQSRQAGSAAGDGELNLWCDRDRYHPGETAHILIESPHHWGAYLITLEREDVTEEQVIFLDGRSQTIGVPIRTEHAPQVYLTVSAVLGESEGEKHPYFAQLPLAVSPGEGEWSIEPMDSPGVLAGAAVTKRFLVTRSGIPVPGVELYWELHGEGRKPVSFLSTLEGFIHDPRWIPVETGGIESRYQLSGGGEGKIQSGKPFYRDGTAFSPALPAPPEGSKSLLRREMLGISDGEGVVTLKWQSPPAPGSYPYMIWGAADGEALFLEGDFQVSPALDMKGEFPSRLREGESALGTVALANWTDGEEPYSLSIDGGGQIVEGEISIEGSLPGGGEKIHTLILGAQVPRRDAVSVSWEIQGAARRGIYDLEVLHREKEEEWRFPAVEDELWLQAEPSSSPRTVLPALLESLNLSDLSLASASAGEWMRYLSSAGGPLLPWGKYQLESGGIPFSFQDETEGGKSDENLSLRMLHLLGSLETEGQAKPGGVNLPGLLNSLEKTLSPWEARYLALLTGVSTPSGSMDDLPLPQGEGDLVFQGLALRLSGDDAGALRALEGAREIWSQGVLTSPGEGKYLGGALLLSSLLGEDPKPFFHALQELLVGAQTPGGLSLDERIWLARGIGAPSAENSAVPADSESASGGASPQFAAVRKILDSPEGFAPRDRGAGVTLEFLRRDGLPLEQIGWPSGDGTEASAVVAVRGEPILLDAVLEMPGSFEGGIFNIPLPGVFKILNRWFANTPGNFSGEIREDRQTLRVSVPPGEAGFLRLRILGVIEESGVFPLEPVYLESTGKVLADQRGGGKLIYTP